jgi:predicted alpha/beta superfamily hydrolase
LPGTARSENVDQRIKISLATMMRKSLALLLLSFLILTSLSYAQEILHQKIKSDILKEDRDIWVCLPQNFNTDHAYPILYLMDGQNLLYDSLAYSGTWKIPSKIQELHQAGLDLIIVAIANAGSGRGRSKEYSWFKSDGNPSGKGATFLNFMCEELIPKLESTYNTIPGKRGIMGSSLGGLISIQALIEHPETFQLGGIFSASFWFNPESMEESYLSRIQKNQKLHLIIGEKEGGGIPMANDQRKASAILSKYLPKDHIHAEVFPDGDHKEWFWAREFVTAVKFLYN